MFPDANRGLKPGAWIGGFIFRRLSFRIIELGIPDICQDFRQEFFRQVVCHGKVHIQIIAAVACCRSGDLPFVACDKGEHFLHERDDVSRIVIPGKEEIKARPASHGTEIDDTVFPGLMIAQERGAKMFDSVDLCCVHDRLIIGAGHADIKCGDDRAADCILPGNIDAGHKPDMVDCKTGDLIHLSIIPFCQGAYPWKYRFHYRLRERKTQGCKGENAMRLYIVRHGETDWNRIHRVQGRTDIPLNDYGRRLARETAEGMKEVRIDLGYTSPLLRAKETAQIILADRGVPLYEDSRIEELSFGSYEGMRTGGEAKEPGSEAFNRFFTDTANYVPPQDAESIPQLYERTGKFLAEICEREDLKDRSILVSTHGAAMTALLNRIRGNLSVSEFWKDEVPPNCSVTEVEVSGGKARIIREGVIYYKEKVRKWKTV